MKEILSEAITFSLKNVSNFEFKDRDEKQVYSVAIYCSIIELAQSFFTLIDTRNSTGSLSIYRTFLENYIDLKNLKLHESYENELAFQNLVSMKESLEAAKKGNVFLTPLKKHAKEKLPELRADIKRLKTIDDKPLSIFKKFKLAGMTSEYLGFYPKLCAEAHSSVSAILERHIEVNKINDSLDISIFKEKPEDEYYYYLCNMAQHLLDAGVILCQILADERINQFVEQRDLVKVKVEKYT